MGKRFRETLSSEWIKYLIVLILSIALWFWVFGLYHAPKDTEKIELFFAGEVKDYSFEDKACAEFDYLKSVSISAAYPWTGNSFEQKYSLVALTASDVVIVPEEVAKETDCKRAFVELSGLGDPFVQEEVAYGVYLSDEAKQQLSPYFGFDYEKYVVFAVAASMNSGQVTNHSIEFIEWLLR